MADEPAQKPPEEPEKKDAIEDRQAARGALPAVFVDTWGFTSWRGHIRITVGEEIGEANIYRFSFLMELKDAEGFARHILRIVERRREKDGAISLRDLKSALDKEN